MELTLAGLKPKWLRYDINKLRIKLIRLDKFLNCYPKAVLNFIIHVSIVTPSIRCCLWLTIHNLNFLCNRDHDWILCAIDTIHRSKRWSGRVVACVRACITQPQTALNGRLNHYHFEAFVRFLMFCCVVTTLSVSFDLNNLFMFRHLKVKIQIYWSIEKVSLRYLFCIPSLRNLENNEIIHWYT